MRYELMDYQRTAAIDVLNRLRRARADWANGDRSSSRCRRSPERARP